MQFYFQEIFINKVKKLLKKKSYKDCEKAIIIDIFKSSVDEIMSACSAKRLNTSSTNPIAKLRVSYKSGKSSSYRIYLYAIVKDEKNYFAFLYPKTGSDGISALKAKDETKIIKTLLENIKSDSIYEVYLNKQRNKICYVSNKKDVF